MSTTRARTWNHRVVRHTSGEQTWFQVHEVYYDHDGKPTSMTKDAPIPMGDDVADLKAELQRMLDACDKPEFEPPEEWNDT